MKIIPKHSQLCSHQLSNPNLVTNTSSIKWLKLMTAPKATNQEAHPIPQVSWVITGPHLTGCELKLQLNNSYQQLSNPRKSVTYRIYNKRTNNMKNSYNYCSSKLTRSNVTQMSSLRTVKKFTKNSATKFQDQLLSSTLKLVSMLPWTPSTLSIRAARCRCWTWSTRLTVRSYKAKGWEKRCVKIKLHFENKFIYKSHQ